MASEAVEPRVRSVPAVLVLLAPVVRERVVLGASALVVRVLPLVLGLVVVVVVVVVRPRLLASPHSRSQSSSLSKLFAFPWQPPKKKYLHSPRSEL